MATNKLFPTFKLASLFTYVRFLSAFVLLASVFLPSSAFALAVTKYVSSAGLITSANLNGLAKTMRVSSDGSIYVVGTSTSTLLKISADLSSASVVSYSQSPTSHASSDFVLDGNTLYLSTSNANYKLYKYTISGTTATYVAEAIATSGTQSVTLGADGYVYNSRSSTANRYDSNLNAAGAYKFVTTPTRMAVDGSTLYYVSTAGALRKVTDYTTGSLGVNGSTDLTVASSLGSGAAGPNALFVKTGGYSYVSTGQSGATASRVCKISPAGSIMWNLTTSSVVTMHVDSTTGDIYTIDTSGTMRAYAPIGPPTSFSISDLASTSLALNWTAGASGTDFQGVTIRSSTSGYPTSPTDGNAVTSNDMGTSLNVTSLSSGTTYYYTIFNMTADGFNSTGVQASAITAPAAPTISAAKPTLNGTTINLSWNTPTGTDHFILKRNDGSVDVNINTNIDDAVTSYSDTNLADGTYSYKIYAVNSNSDSSDVGISSALTIDTTAPNAPSLSASKATVNGTTINLSWDVPSGTDTFTLQRSVNGGGYVNVQTGIASSTTSMSQTGLSDGTYTYKVFAVDAYGNVSNAGISSTLTIDTTAPSAPNLSATLASPTGSTINLSWDIPLGTDTFILQRSFNSAGYANVQTGIAGSTTTYQQTSLSDGIYTYKLFAVDTYGNISNAGTSSTLTIDTSGPSAPNLSATLASPTGSTINLSWDVPSGTDTFILQRSFNSAGYVNVQTGIAGATTTYQQTSLSDGTYAYKLFAVDTVGNISNAGTSSTLTVDTTPPSPPTGVAADADGATILITWTNPISDFDSITIRRSTSAFPTSITDGTLVATNLTGTSFEEEDLALGTYYYSLFAKDTRGNVSIAANVTVVNAGVTPTVSTDDAEEIDDSGAVFIGVLDDIGTSDVIVRGFEFGETTGYGSTIQEDGTFTAEEFGFVVEDLDCGTTYHYRAFAVNETGTAYGEDKTFATSACASASSLAITVQAPTNPVQINSTTTFAVTVDNSGMSDSNDTVISFTLSDNMAFVSAEIIATSDESESVINTSISQATSCTGTNPVSCDIGAVPASSSVTLSITVRAISTGPMSLGASTGDDDSPGSTATTSDSGGAVDTRSLDNRTAIAGCALNTNAIHLNFVGIILVSSLLFLFMRHYTRRA